MRSSRGSRELELDPLLSGLVRKEVLGVQADPRSPERGQYGFLQDLVRRVAYETLARRDRKARHLAAASLLERGLAGEQEIVEVVAAHYVAAYEAQPDADDATQIKAKARGLLARAGERAASLGALEEAARSLEQAAELTDEGVEQALLLERAAWWAMRNADSATADRHFRASLDLLTKAGERHSAARVAGLLGNLETTTGKPEQGLRRMEEAFAAVADDEPDEDIANLASRLATSYAFLGDVERATEVNELALAVSQALRLPEQLSRALANKAYLARIADRPDEELALMRYLVRHAQESDLPAGLQSSAYGNLSDACFAADRYSEALEALAEALALARRGGDRYSELFALSETSYALTMTGRWDDAMAIFDALPAEATGNSNYCSVLTGVLEIYLHRGNLDPARELLDQWSDLDNPHSLQDRAIYLAASAAGPPCRGAILGVRRRRRRGDDTQRGRASGQAGSDVGCRIGNRARRHRARGQAAEHGRGASARAATAVPRRAGTAPSSTHER